LVKKSGKITVAVGLQNILSISAKTKKLLYSRARCNLIAVPISISSYVTKIFVFWPTSGGTEKL